MSRQNSGKRARKKSLFLGILDSFSSSLYKKISSSATGHFFSCKRESADPLGFLEKIGLSDADTLYVLGDVVDRGPQGLKVLQDMMLRGNVLPVVSDGQHQTAEVILG